MAGTTNALQWNPTAANQETDAVYAADSQRVGGATNPSVFDARLANKLFYQLTTFVTALAQAMANKGFSTSDANLATLTTQMANLWTTADVKSPLLAIPFSTTLLLDAGKANGFQVVLTADTTVSFTGTPSAPLLLVFIQDGVGGHNVTYSSTFRGAGTVDPAPNSFNTQSFALCGDLALHAITPMVVS